MNRIRHIAIMTFILLSALQMQGEYFRHLTLGDGLSQSSVMSIAQDKLGRMWFGTKEGVNIYDGAGIRAFKGWISQNNGKEKIWIGNNVKYIVSDSIGNMFMFIDDDLIKYNIGSDRFSHFTNNANVKALASNKGEVVYISGDSVFVKNLHDDKTRFALKLNSIGKIRELEVDARYYYISTNNGVVIFDRKSKSSKRFLKGMDIYACFVSRDGTLWITTVEHGLYRYRKGDSEPMSVSMPTATVGVMGAEQCRNAIEDSNGKIWYGTFSGLFCYDPDSGETRHIEIPQSIGGLTHSSVYGMCCDRKGNLWIGTFYGGVNYFSPNRDKFLNFNYEEFAQRNLAHSFVKEIVSDSDGNLWFATDGAGVGCLDKNWNLTRHLSTLDVHNPLRQNNIRCLEYDRNGNRLFIGTHMGGLSVYDITQGSVTNLIDDPQYKSVPGNVIHALIIRNGSLYISSRAGISIMDLQTGSIRKIKNVEKPKMFDIDNEGNIYYISNAEHVVYKITDPTSDHPVVTRVSPRDSKIFPTQVCAFNNGVLITTLGNGVLYYPDGKSKAEYINTSTSALPDDYCYAVRRGPKQSVFITAGNNVVKINMADRSMKSVSFSDFFPESHIINECALLTLPEGDILVGSTKGITRINHENFRLDASTENSPQIYFSRLLLHNKDISPDKDSGILETSFPFTSEITLPSENNNFTIIVGVSDYVATTGTTTIEYLLDKVDDNWQSTTGNEISYRNLTPGKYKLHARLQGRKEITLDILVNTPWYTSWWAWLIYLAIATALAYFIIHKILTETRLRNELYKEKMEREQIEKDSREKLISFTNVSQEFQSSLSTIVSHIDLLVSKYKKHIHQIEGTSKPSMPISEIDMAALNPIDRNLLIRTSEFIEKNIENQELDIPLLCREVGVSRSLFFDKFKVLTGMTPNAFILNYRLQYAVNLLTNHPHLSISEIAEKTGFSSALYFSRCFKKNFGVSPLSYRKQQERDAD